VLGVVGAFVGHLVGRQLVVLAGAAFLQPGLVVLTPGAGCGLDDALAEQPHDQTGGRLRPLVEVHGADDRLGRIGENRRLLSAP
jgi:hypothetical protein